MDMRNMSSGGYKIPTIIKCQRCGGQVLVSYGEYSCLQCSAAHDKYGDIIPNRIGRKGFLITRDDYMQLFTKTLKKQRKELAGRR